MKRIIALLLSIVILSAMCTAFADDSVSSSTPIENLEEDICTLCAFPYGDSVFTVSVNADGTASIEYQVHEDDIPEDFAEEVESLTDVKSLVKYDDNYSYCFLVAIHKDGSVSVTDLAHETNEPLTEVEEELETWENIKSITIGESEFGYPNICGVTKDGKVKICNMEFSVEESEIALWEDVDRVIVGCDTLIAITTDGTALGSGYLFTEDDYAIMYGRCPEISSWDKSIEGFIVNDGPGPTWLTVDSNGKLSGNITNYFGTVCKPALSCNCSKVYAGGALMFAALTADGDLYYNQNFGDEECLLQDVKEFMFPFGYMLNYCDGIVLTTDGRLEIASADYESEGHWNLITTDVTFQFSTNIVKIIDAFNGFVIVQCADGSVEAVPIEIE